MLLLLALLAWPPAVERLPVVRQSAALWRETVRENRLPANSVGWWDSQGRRIVLLWPHPEEWATIEHERAHAAYDMLSPEAQAEWEAGWREWGSRMPWEPARRRAAESWAYVSEAISPHSPYSVALPSPAVALLLRLRREP